MFYMSEKSRAFFKNIYKQFTDIRLDIISAYSASATLFLIISIFPIAIILLSCLRLLPFSDSYFNALGIDFIPAEIKHLIGTIVREINSQALDGFLPFAIITVLWMASSAFASLMQGLNIVCGCKETRKFILTRILCVVYTVIFMAMIVLTLVLLVFWNNILQWLGEIIPFITPLSSILMYFRIIAVMLVLTIYFALLYKFAPNKKKGFLRELPGALLASAGWVLFSYIYSMYLSYTADGSAIYGSLSAVVFLIIWLYSCILILFVGAHINELLAIQRQKKRSSQHENASNQEERLDLENVLFPVKDEHEDNADS